MEIDVNDHIARERPGKRSKFLYICKKAEKSIFKLIENIYFGSETKKKRPAKAALSVFTTE